MTFAITVIVNAIDTQRWICRTHAFQFTGTSRLADEQPELNDG